MEKEMKNRDSEYLKTMLDEIETFTKELNQNSTPPKMEPIEPINISSWKGFGDFFDQPMVKAVMFLRDEPIKHSELDLWSDVVQVIYPCCCVTVTNESKEIAIKGLKAVLLKAKKAGGVSVGFLAKPTTLKLHNGLTAAFCFLFGYFKVKHDVLTKLPFVESYVHQMPFNQENWNYLSQNATSKGGI